MEIEYIRMDLEDIMFRMGDLLAEYPENLDIEEALDNLENAVVRLEEAELDLSATPV